jgi:hypothetical protein
MLLDGLWFAGILTNKQRKDATHDLRRLVYGLGREIIDLERRARESAVRAGKDAALAEADAESDTKALVTGSLVDEDSGKGSTDAEASTDQTGQASSSDAA